MIGFQRSAQNRGQVSDILCGQEVVLHETLDVAHTRMRGIAEPDRNLALDVEGQPLLRTIGHEMHVTAYGPEEVFAATEQSSLVLIEHAMLDQFLGLRTR